jgi:hypothetical protein
VQKYRRIRKLRRRQIIGVDKTLAHEKLGDNKIEASSKHRRPQMLAQEKVGEDAEFAAADFSQAPLMVSYFSLMNVLLPVHVDVKSGQASLCPVFQGGLSPALYRLIVPAYFTGLPCLKWSKPWRLPKPWRPPKIH